MNQAGLDSRDAERLRAFERQGHDALAASYRSFFAAVTALAHKPLLDAVHLRRDAHLLDVATGHGALAAEAAEQGARAVGADLSPRMIEMARRSYPHIDFHEADVEQLSFPDCTFDAVLCSFGIGHFPRPEVAIGECVRTLKPGGRIALSWWDTPARQRIQGIFRDALTEVGVTMPPDVPQHHNVYRFSDSAEFSKLLNGARLVGIEVNDHATTYSVTDTETLWSGGLGSLVLTGAAIRHQDKPTQDKIRAAFERYALAYKGDDGLNLPIAFKVGSGQRPH